MAGETVATDFFDPEAPGKIAEIPARPRRKATE